VKDTGLLIAYSQTIQRVVNLTRAVLAWSCRRYPRTCRSCHHRRSVADTDRLRVDRDAFN